MLESASYPTPGGSSASDSFVCRPVRHRKVAILGFGESVKDCPWQDESWSLWAMNGFWRAAEPDFGITAPEDRYSLWLDMHTLEYTRAYGKLAGFDDKQERWLEQPHPFPVYMLDAYPQFPAVQPFPVEELVAAVGRDYFTSTVAYALAFALMHKDTIAEVGLWGIDLVHSSEYADQRPCAEYWIGRLEAAGVKVTIADESALLRARHRYGYEVENPLYAEMRDALEQQAAGVRKAIEENKAQLEALRIQLHTDDGALQAIRGALERLNAWHRGGRI